MKFISTAVLCLLLVSATMASRTPYVRVKIESKQDVYPLLQAGFNFLDVRRLPGRDAAGHHRFEYIPDMGYVTVRGGAATAQRLAEMGYPLIKTGVYSSPPAPAGAEKSLPFQFGWPKTMTGWPGVYGQATTVDDLNNDGKPEVFLSNVEGYIYMWRYNGTFVPGYPRNPFSIFAGINPSTGDSVFASWVTTGTRETAAAGDVDGDGQKECVFGKDIGYLFAYPAGPGVVPGFPRNMGLLMFSNEPALYDLDGDGRDEIVLMTYLDDYYYPNYPAALHIFNQDGSELPGWPQVVPVESESSPVIGDIDGDWELEIVVGSGRNSDAGIPGQILAWNLDGSLCSGFPIEVGNAVESTPSLADIDLNGIADILIRVKMQSTGVNGIYAFNGQGQLLSGFPAVLTYGGSRGAPAVADMDGDGLPDIAYGTAMAIDSGMVWAFNYDGSLKAGFPQLVHATWVEESVALTDVSGDGLPDIVATTNGVSGDPGAVWAFDYQGQVVSGFPLITPDVIGSSLESAPTVLDIDGDGDTELFTANWDNTVFCWDTPGQWVPENAWPMFKYDAARTGNSLLTPVGLPAHTKTAPEQTVLFPNYPNPFNPQTTISFLLPSPQRVSLEIYNLVGEKVAELVNDRRLSAGLHKVRWRAEAQAGGIYFYRIRTSRNSLSGKMILLK